MSTVNLGLAKKVDAIRIKRLAIVQAKYPGLFVVGGPPEEYLLELAPYFLDKPQKFYYEPVYEKALAYLTNYYNQHPSDLVSHFQYVAESWWKGVANTEHYSRVIEQLLPSDLSREAVILNYWREWYFNLVEDCLKNVCSPWVWAIQQAEGKTGTLENMRYMSNRSEKLNKITSLQLITKDFEPTVRNACAHGGVTVIKKTLLQHELVSFKDSKGTVEWSDYEFMSHIQGMLDVCNALILAAKVLIFCNWSKLAPIFDYPRLPEAEREKLFLLTASTPAVEVKRSDLMSLGTGITQVLVEAEDSAQLYEELVYDVLAILQHIHRFYPDTDRVMVNLRGNRHLPSWVQVPTALLRDWASGAIELDQFLGSSDAQFMIFQFKRLPLPRKLTFLRRGFARALPQFKDELGKIRETMHPRRWSITKVEDKTFKVKRLHVNMLVPEGLTKKEIEPMLVEGVKYVREKLYRTPEVEGYKRRYRKHMAERRPGYVWLFVFTREKRPADMWADPTASYFVCRAEWFDQDLRKQGLEPVLNLADQINDTHITVDWSPLII